MTKQQAKIGERTKRETAEKQAKTKAKEEPKDDKDIEFPFNKDDGLEINDPNAPEIDAPISDEDIPGAIK